MFKIPAQCAMGWCGYVGTARRQGESRRLRRSAAILASGTSMLFFRREHADGRYAGTFKAGV